MLFVDRPFFLKNCQTENSMVNDKKIKNPLTRQWIQRLGIPLAAVPIIWIYWRLDFHAMISMLPKVAWWTGPMLLIAVISGMVLQGLRWWILLHAFIPALRLRRALSYHFMAVFYGTALPSGAAPDVIKTLFVAQKNEMETSWAAFWLTRALGLPSLALLSMSGFFVMDASSLPRGWQFALVFFYLATGALFAISFSKRITRPLRLLLEKFIPKKTLSIVGRIRQSVYCYRSRKKEILLSFLVTVAVQAFLIIACSLSIRGITGTFPLWQCFTFIPIIELISVSFPFTPNGMGVRETLSAGMFSYLHLSKEQLGIYVMFSLFFSLFPRLLGIPLIIHGHLKKSAAAGNRPDRKE